MNDCWKGLYASRTAFKSFAFLVGSWLAFEAPALAQQQQTPPCDKRELGWTISNPSLDDQRKIMDVLSSYAWTIDDRNANAFVALFVQAETSFYELCNAGGLNQVFKLTFNNAVPAENLETEMGIITKELGEDELQTRHLVTNTLFKRIDDETVETKSTVLVTVQDSDLAAPVLDYSADVRGRLVKDKEGNWKFENLTVYTDNGPAVARKR